MAEVRHRHWARRVLQLAVLYGLVGVVFALPTTHVHVWRLAAWIVSAASYLSHVVYERFRLRNPPRVAALHVALAAALGASILAAAALIRSVTVGSGHEHQRLLLIAIVVWPLMTGVPAFVVGLLTSWVLDRIPRSIATR